MSCRKSNDLPKISVNSSGFLSLLPLRFCFTQLFHLSLRPATVLCSLLCSVLAQAARGSFSLVSPEVTHLRVVFMKLQ